VGNIQRFRLSCDNRTFWIDMGRYGERWQVTFVARLDWDGPGVGG
jgi:hypothetical protein